MGLWGRKVSDLGFAEFMSILEAIADQRGNEFLDGQIRVEQFSNVQPIWQLIILSILTCGLYDTGFIEIGSISKSIIN